MGHDGLSGDTIDGQIGFLQAQLNRYTADGGAPTEPLNLQIFPGPMPVTGILDAETASRGLMIVHQRSLFDGDMDMYQRLLREGFPNPIGFVTKNLQMVIDIAKTYGDLHAVPAAKSVNGALFMNIPMEVLVIGGAIAAYLLLFRKKR